MFSLYAVKLITVKYVQHFYKPQWSFINIILIKATCTICGQYILKHGNVWRVYDLGPNKAVRDAVRNISARAP